MKSHFKKMIGDELMRLDALGTSKRHERVIEGFTKEACPRAIINGKHFMLFNSNDYLGLRFNGEVHQAEIESLEKYGGAAGAVRFISGTLRVHVELEEALARFHHREAAMLFSSAFSANVSVIQALCKGPSAGSLVSDNVAIVSDELNHRSIIDGIRIANLPTESRAVFCHGDYDSLKEELEKKAGKFKRVLVISDGVFSMLGKSADVKKIREIVNDFDDKFEDGVLFILDDSHGVGCFGQNGRGCEEIYGAKSDLLVGTLGKAFGVEGGYVAGDKIIIDYLREAAASYIYSNPVSPASAGAALEALRIVDSKRGEILLEKLRANITYFKEQMKRAGFVFAADSQHTIQPILVGDSQKTKNFTQALFDEGVLVTPINYPVVPKGREEIRVQLSALHNRAEIESFVVKAKDCAKITGVL